MAELKPCAHCGSDNLKLFGESAPEWWISCMDCFASSPTKGGRQNSIDAWNRRATDKTIDQHRAEFEQFYDPPNATQKKSVSREADGTYVTVGAFDAWNIWCAARGVNP